MEIPKKQKYLFFPVDYNEMYHQSIYVKITCMLLI